METQTPFEPAPMPTPQGPGHAQKNTLMAILAYIGPLIIVSFLVAKDDPFVKYHIKQGLILFIPWIVIWVFGSALWHIWAVINLINAAIVILAILGIINAAKGEEKELPFVGHMASNFKF